MTECVSHIVLFALTPAAWVGPVVPVPVPDEFKNPWPAEWEPEFQAVGQRLLKGMCK